MKKITFLFVFSFFAILIGTSQTTAIPDPNFEQALIDAGLDSGPIDGSVPTANIASVTFLNVFNENISNLTGIEDFTALSTLVCGLNNLTNLDVSQNTQLTSLSCGANPLTSLDVSNNTALEVLSCGNSFITNLTLPPTPNNLAVLDIKSTDLTTLEVSNFLNLANLDCSVTPISSLNIDNCNSLTTLDASDSSLSSIDLSTNTALATVDLSNNQFTNIDINNNTLLEDADFSGNDIETLDFSNNPNLIEVVCSNNELISLDLRNGNNTAIGFGDLIATNNPNLFCISVDDVSYAESTWNNIDPQTIFELDCNATTFIPDDNFEQALIDLGLDSGPLDDFVLTTVISNITSLDVSNQSISDFTGINAFTSLVDLNVSQNAITQSITFQIPNLINLEVLICAINQLDALDLSGNPNLREINCSTNNLTNLDISNNPGLEIIYCNSNNLTGLDTSDNPALTELRINNNPIASLDLSNNTALNDLRCFSGNLVNLDVSNNTALTQIFCYNNQITDLDCSNNTLLADIRCQNNDLSNLDIRNGNNTNFTTFDATNNPNLTCISVDDVVYAEANFTNIDAQTSFSPDCNVPQTAIPDINFELALISFGFDTAPANGFVPTGDINTITNLPFNNRNISDLTGIEDFTSLESLTVSNNSLTTLDLSNNSALESLVCFNNNLSALDVSNNLALQVIVCSNNSISSLDLSNNTALTNINCNTNALTELDVSNGNNVNITNQFFNATNNPSLNCIEVDDASYSTNNWFNIDAQSQFSENCSTLSLNEFVFDSAAIKLYPNPSNNEVYIDVPKNIKVEHISIIDISGKILSEYQIDNNAFSVSNLKKGVYLIQLHNNDNIVTKKLMVY